jgi:hypothetical protein
MTLYIPFRLLPNPMKKIHLPIKYSNSVNTRRGFALIATLTLMILLAILAMGMLSLSAVSLRSSAQTNGISEARANARMALMIAIGELQKQMGPDQRISANASILSESPVINPMWTGVWDSWIAGPLSANRNPNYPSTVSHQQTIGNPSDPTSMHPRYAEKNKHFRAWLLSLNPSEVESITTAGLLTLDGKRSPSIADTAILLVGEKSLGNTDPTEFVSARLLPVKSQGSSAVTGRYGWWAGDESLKARLLQDTYSQETGLSLAKKLARTQAPASTGTSVIPGLELINPVQEAALVKITSFDSLNLLLGNGTMPAKKNFHTITADSMSVLADVREGGLKRDLSTILERTIDPNEVYELQPMSSAGTGFRRASALKTESGAYPAGVDFMLYNFDSINPSSNGKTGEACVPIQDLAAYYQLYDSTRAGWKNGIQFSTSQSSPSNTILTGGVMVSNPDLGRSDIVTVAEDNKYLRQHSAPYRNVYPVKIEFVLSYLTEIRTQTEMDVDRRGNPAARPPVPPNPNPDEYKLRLGITPAMTFWNPNNVPVAMNFGNPDLQSIMIRETPMPMQITFRKHNAPGGPPVVQNTVQFSGLTNTQQGELYTFYVSGNQRLVFQPGESKVLALQAVSNTNAAAGAAQIDFLKRAGFENENFSAGLELVPGWNATRFVRTLNNRGPRSGLMDVMTFKVGDSISAALAPGTGNSFRVDFTQQSRHTRSRNSTDGGRYHYRSYGIFSREFPANPGFRTPFVAAGLPPAAGTILRTAFPPTPGLIIPERSGQTLVDSMQDPANFLDDLPQAFFYYGLKASTETHESRNLTPISGAGSARRFPARPFTHSTLMMPNCIESITPESLYNNGWNWFFSPLANLIDAPISISASNFGYYGGGYTAENGTTHVVQQELPLTPPMSIAALSHAQLSGYSLSSESAVAGFSDLPERRTGTALVTSEAFRRTTALGFGGLEPRTLQAIGNSYAHPYIPKDRVLTTINRVYLQTSSGTNQAAEPFADHSYLANKALWDDYFFSSITPIPANNPIYNETARTVDQVTRDFISETRQLANRRMVPYKKGLDDSKITSLLSLYSQYKDGFADKIAANMMVEGAFNINSTSEAAWKIFFSSLRGKSVTYLEPSDAVSGSLLTKDHKPDGTPVGSGALANGKPITGSSSDPSDPEQWTGWRELTDQEINELAKAMVKQVKKRGPFLSLSEFVNRRLDAASNEFSVMGALQAAIDDPDCSINAGFRNDLRKFSTLEKTYSSATFPQAMEGAVAYGSSAYVDQADILRNFAEQLTPRGDTFVIRAYGDSIDASGNIVARAWCEAVVQRVPEYVDSADEPHVKQVNLTSASNIAFGRKFEVKRFRWLQPSEI